MCRKSYFGKLDNLTTWTIWKYVFHMSFLKLSSSDVFWNLRMSDCLTSWIWELRQFEFQIFETLACSNFGPWKRYNSGTLELWSFFLLHSMVMDGIGWYWMVLYGIVRRLAGCPPLSSLSFHVRCFMGSLAVCDMPTAGEEAMRATCPQIQRKCPKSRLRRSAPKGTALCQRAKWCQKPMSPDFEIKNGPYSFGLVERVCGIGVNKREAVKATESAPKKHTNAHEELEAMIVHQTES